MPASAEAPDQPTLHGVNAKLNRGFEHLRTLNDLVREWQERKPFSTVTERNSEGTEFHIGIEFHEFPDLLHWGLLAGEILFNYRCALDHMVYALAVAGSSANPPPGESQLAFPITSDPDSFQEAKGRRLRSVPEAAISVIQEAQPFRCHDPSRYPLFRLHRLNNVDKHRLIHVAAFGLREIKASFSGLPEGEVEVAVNEDPLERISPLMRVRVSRPVPGIEGEFRALIRIAFPDEPKPRRSMLETLEAIRQTVLGLTDQLRSFV